MLDDFGQSVGHPLACSRPIGQPSLRTEPFLSSWPALRGADFSGVQFDGTETAVQVALAGAIRLADTRIAGRFQVIDARARQGSTAVVTNIDFKSWSDYLGDPPLATAFLDRVVDGAIILKIKGKSYRAHRANPARTTPLSAS
jgi:hypothetical protein